MSKKTKRQESADILKWHVECLSWFGLWVDIKDYDKVKKAQKELYKLVEKMKKGE